jgi:plastocyanin
MRTVTRAVTVGLLLAVLLPGTGSAAATTKIQELNFVFTPDPVHVQLGDTLTWQNGVRNLHTSTDQSPLLLWDSGLMAHGQTYSYAVTAAGTYPYFCQLHERFGMFGTFQVKDVASPPTGPVGTVFTIQVATVPAPLGFVYDIEKRDPHGGFVFWKSVASTLANFDSSGLATGVYGFRSRLRRLSDDAATTYSPAATILVTAVSIRRTG